MRLLTDERSPVILALRITVLLAGGFAEAWNLVNMVGNGEPVTEHFAYFTIQSNLLVLALVVWQLGGWHRPRWFDGFRGSVTASIVLAGLVWSVLLASPDEVWGTGVAYTSFAQHRLIPWLMAIDWLLVRTECPIRVGRAIGAAMLYPIAYLAVSWLRGGLVDGWFPYPFLDPAVHGGWAGLVWPTGQVLIAFVVGITVVMIAGRLRWGRAPAP